MAKVKYSKGDKVKLLSHNDSYAKHPTEQRDLKAGDIIEVHDWDNDDEAIIYKIDYSPDNDGGKIWLCIDQVELVGESSSVNDGDCTCSTHTIMATGCTCGAIKRYKPKY